MLDLTDIALYNYFKWRQKKIDRVISDPVSYQNLILQRILKSNERTSFGLEHQFRSIRTYKDYKKSVPLRTYEDLFPYIEATLNGIQNVLVKDKVRWFAKSSGTSNAKSKYIPVTKEYMVNGHLKCSWDVASFIYHEDPGAKLFANKSLIMCGSIETLTKDVVAGDISALIIYNFPKIGRRFYTPDFNIALHSDWEYKIKEMAKITSKENVTLLAGVPSWTLVLLKEILKITGASNISEIWPNLRSYLHGGVGFEPYEEEYKRLLPSSSVTFREAYNASEGYFAMQNHKADKSMLLLCDHEIFYEFIPLDQKDEELPEVYSLNDVEQGKDYVLVISNTSGLYRYRLGDVVRFASVHPYKIKYIGRERGYLNAFGEELSEHNTNQALAETCRELGINIVEYMVCPSYMNADKSGRHDWYVEFKKEPDSLSTLEKVLDNKLRALNSDYDAKRTSDLTMENLKIFPLRRDTFKNWFKSSGKYGGQNKLVRLHNNRKVIRQILSQNSADHQDLEPS